MEKLIIVGTDYFQQKHINDYIEKHSDDIYESYFGDSLDKSQLYDFISSTNLFGLDQFVIIRNADKVLSDKKLMESLGKSTVVSVFLLTENMPKKGKGKNAIDYNELGFKFLEESNKESNQVNEVISLFKNINITLDQNTANIILERCFFNLSVIINEVNKISTYNHNTSSPITNKNILDFIEGMNEEKIYLLTSAFGKKDIKEVFRIYKTLNHNDNNDFMLFGALNKYIIKLYEIKLDPSILDSMGFRAKYVKMEADKWSIKELTKAIDKASDLDLEVKTGIITINDAVMDILMIIK